MFDKGSDLDGITQTVDFDAPMVPIVLAGK